MHHLRLAAALAFAALTGITACSAPPKLTADQYYQEANEAFDDENHDVAISRYKELLDNYPFDDHAEQAELKIAQSYYHRKQYPEAIAAFNDFQRMHPMSPHLAEVYLLLGECYKDQMTGTDRDQAAAENASGWYRTVIDRYPQQPEADQALAGLQECRASLGDHELYIARYYIGKGNLPAGENRVKGILEQYADTEAATHALEDLARAYESAGDAERAERAYTAAAERVADMPPIPDDPPEGPSVWDGMLSYVGLGGSAPAVDRLPSAKPVVMPAPGPAFDAVLADLRSRYGTGQAVAQTATPNLVDPLASPKMPVSDPGSVGTSVGGMRGSGMGRGY